jgi:molecular chaperone GrpE
MAEDTERTAGEEQQDTSPAETEEIMEADAAAEEGAGAEEESLGDILNEDELEVIRLQEELVRREEEIASLKDQLLRKQADFDNFRKRMFREKEESIRYANAKLLGDLIAVIDDFERAIGSAENSTDFESFLSGIKLIEKQFVGMLERNWGLKRMETIGKEFDPQEHEALMMEECGDCATQTVLEDYQKGYFLHDRVIRHAKVKVGVPKEGEKKGKKKKSSA